MNQQAYARISQPRQGGFTLIELIVVIVILGILAATALPKFMSMGADARVASLGAARSALQSTSALAHGRFLANTDATKPANFTSEGITSDYSLVGGVNTGYLKAGTALAQLAGVNDDYAVVQPGHSVDNNGPTTTGTQIAIVPRSAMGTAGAKTCYVMYTEATSSTAAATVSAIPSVANCE